MAIDIKQLTMDSLQIGGGFALAGYGGRYLENRFITTPVDSTSSITNKILAWGVNNAPKAVAYLLLSKVDAVRDIAKGIVGSITFDSLVRVANNGPNPLNVTLKGYRILSEQEKADAQRLIQENSSLRTQLNSALQKISAQTYNSNRTANTINTANKIVNTSQFGMR